MIKPCPVCGSEAASKEYTFNQIDLVKCTECDFVFANLEDTYITKINSGYDDNQATAYQDQQTLIDDLWFQRIAKKLTRNKEPGRVLDVGCGNGVLLLKFVDLGWKTHGVDVSPWTKDYAERIGFKYYQTTIEAGDFPSDHFDLVVSTSTLEHIAQPRIHVREILRVLKPGGVAYFSGIPNYGKILRGRAIFFESNGPPGHVNYFSAGSMRNLFSQSDIAGSVNAVKVNTYGLPYLHVFYRFMNNYVRRSSVKTNDVRAGTFKENGMGSVDGERTGEINNSNENNNIKAAPSSNQAAGKIALAKLFIEMNYLLGKVQFLGDKIEVVVEKRESNKPGM